ncbi:MAG: 30S ribosomal protein S18 [Candidatus Omnitrophota bacterium]
MSKKKVITKTRRVFKKKPCRLCKDKVEKLDYKDVDLLKRFISDRGKITPPRLTGSCAKHQRMISNGIKKARLAALLPFVKVKEGLARGRGRRQS